MHVIPIYLNVDGHVATPVDAYNAVRSTPPSLMRGVRALLCLRLVDDEGNPDDAGIAALVGWEFVLAGDWNTSTTPEIRVTTGITVVSMTIGTKTYREIQIPLTELNTEELISKLGNNPSADLGAELVGFEAGETDPGFLIQFTMRVYNRRSTAGTGTPTPVDDGLYSSVQIDSLLAMYCTTIATDNKLAGYALTTHNHDGIYAATVHSHALGDVTGLMAELNAKAAAATVEAHLGNTENPHSVNKAQVGLGNVNNTADADKPVSTAQQIVLDAKADAATVNTHIANTDIHTSAEERASTLALTQTAQAHLANIANPHAVTKAQVGLGNVDNIADIDKPISTTQQAALDDKAAADHNHETIYAAKSSEHAHSNMAVLEKFTEDTSGSPLYNGKSMVGSSSSGGALLSSDFFAVNPGVMKSSAIGGGGSFTGGLSDIADYSTTIYQDFLTSTFQTT